MRRRLCKIIVISYVLTCPSMSLAKVVLTDNFLTALAIVESENDPNAMGDKKDGVYRAIGCFQLWKIYVRDANKIALCIGFDYEDRKDPVLARKMVRLVLGYWMDYHERNGRKIGYAELCSLHRHPGMKWRPKRMDCKLERNRTKKLLRNMERLNDGS